MYMSSQVTKSHIVKENHETKGIHGYYLKKSNLNKANNSNCFCKVSKLFSSF